MSQENPNSEERERMVNDAVRHAMSTSPELKEKPIDDVERLFKSFYDKCMTARDVALPKIESGIQSNLIHSVHGRREVLMSLHNALLDVFRDYNRDEAVFLLAWSHANWILQENV